MVVFDIVSDYRTPAYVHHRLFLSDNAVPSENSRASRVHHATGYGYCVRRSQATAAVRACGNGGSKSRTNRVWLFVFRSDELLAPKN